MTKLIIEESQGEPTFQPKLEALLDELETNPKRYPKKQGKLAHCRTANLVRYNGIVWRMVFTLDETNRVVYVIALALHDEAYSEAERRI